MSNLLEMKPIKPDDGVTVELAEMIAGCFRPDIGVNSVTWHIRIPEIGRLEVTVRKEEGQC